MKFLWIPVVLSLAACGVDGAPERPAPMPVEDNILIVSEPLVVEAPATYVGTGGMVRTTEKVTAAGSAMVPADL